MMPLRPDKSSGVSKLSKPYFIAYLIVTVNSNYFNIFNKLTYSWDVFTTTDTPISDIQVVISMIGFIVSSMNL